MRSTPSTPQILTVMTVNIHKGFNIFNRRFILPELRDAVRKVGADVQVQMYCAADVRGTVANADVIRAV